MLNRVTLKSKLLFAFFIVTSFSVVITTLVSIGYFSEKINESGVDSMQRALRIAQLIYENKQQDLQTLVSTLANDSSLQLLTRLGSQEKIVQYLADRPELQNYQQIQMAIEQAKSWKFEDLDFNDGNLLENFDIRDEIQDATKQVNRQLNNVRKIRDTFEKENMQIGNKKFSMKDLLKYVP